MCQNWQSIRHNQINCSRSKQTYGFPKQKRFRSTSKLLCDSIYDIPSSIGGSQAWGMTKSKKLSLTKQSISPAPNKYQIQSTFHKNHFGVKFALGRQHIKHNAIRMTSNTPDPTKYHINSSISPKKGISIHSKLNTIQPTNKKNPGPGHYQSLSTLNCMGRYVLSSVNNCAGVKIVNHKDYDVSQNLKGPGPGHYNESKQNINSQGKYFNSKHQNSRCRVFSRTSRNKCGFIAPSITPGPGNYNKFSQFGLNK